MRPFERISTALAIICAVLAPMTPARAKSTDVIQSYDTYKSWFVACDNTLVCVAKGFSDSNTPSEIKITRQPGGRGEILMEIRSTGRFALSDVRIDGKPVKLMQPAWRITSDGDITSAFSRDLNAIQILLGQLRNAAKLTAGGDGEVQLDGFAAALLRLDDQQGRVGGITSIARPGPAPASEVAHGPSVPKIAARPITATLTPTEARRLIRVVRTDQKATLVQEDCELNIGSMKAEAFALDAGRALVFIPCLEGAYQGSSLGFLADRNGSGVHLLTAPAPYLGKGAHDTVIKDFTESDFDPKTGMLSMSAKGRGMADCGFSASWVWNGQTMVLTSMAFQDACGGVEPGDWPTLFRSVQ